MTEDVELNYLVSPSRRLRGELRMPGDKSISHRSIMLGALADGVTEVSGFLNGEDCLATLAAFRDLGVVVDQPEPSRLRIHGVGLRGLSAPRAPLDVGNSGTAMRLLAGVLAGQDFTSTLTGDGSLRGRPMRRVTEPLTQMGAVIVSAGGGTAPLTLRGGALRGIDYASPVASAQVKSCLLLAGLNAAGRTRISEPGVTRDHTERMLRGFGYPVGTGDGWVAVDGGGRLNAVAVEVPGDISSAAFFLVGASIAADAELTLTGVGVNPTRDGVVQILELMGADIVLSNRRERSGEPVADLTVRSAKLRGVRIPEHLVPLAIDEFPALFVAAAAADGETVLTGAAELRVKESDRIQAMADGLSALGAAAEPTADGIVIRGGAPLGGGEIDSFGDHRIAMAFAMAGLIAAEPILIKNCVNVATSFPGFVELAAGAGLQLAAVTA